MTIRHSDATPSLYLGCSSGESSLLATPIQVPAELAKTPLGQDPSGTGHTPQIQTKHMSVFNSAEYVENHSGTKDNRVQYPCLHQGCNRVLMSMYTRQVHMSTHKAKPRKSFKCTMGCNVQFTRQHDRQRHEVAQHGKKFKHVCQRCSRMFAGQKKLDSHTCHGRRQGTLRWPLDCACKYLLSNNIHTYNLFV